MPPADAGLAVREPTIVALVVVDGIGVEPWSQWSFKGPGYDFALPPSWPPPRVTVNGQEPFGGALSPEEGPDV